MALRLPFIIQEYIDTGGTDIRALVVGDKVIAAMRRKAQTEEKKERTSMPAGRDSRCAIDLSDNQLGLSSTARALKADICGVDILRAPRTVSHRREHFLAAGVWVK